MRPGVTQTRGRWLVVVSGWREAIKDRSEALWQKESVRIHNFPGFRPVCYATMLMLIQPELS